jgi:predicted MFS family arabinose efflux permease
MSKVATTQMPAGASSTASNQALRAFTFGNFVIGIGVMVLPGMLNEVASGLQVSLPVAGQLIGIAGLFMAVGAPLLASMTSTIDRRHLLVAALLVYGLGHLACALAPGYVSGAVVFTPQAAASVGLMVPAQQRASAVTRIFMGWSIASIIGMPLGNLLAAWVSWRAGFAVVGVAALIAAIWVARVTPKGLMVPRVSLQAWAAVLRNHALLWVLSVTLLSAAGQFILLSYIAPSMLTVTRAGPGTIAIIMVLFGVAGFVGNIIANRNIDRIGADRTVLITTLMMTAGMLSWAAIAISPVIMAWPLLSLAMLLWGMGCFACNSAQQARLVALAPALASMSIALNTSSMYAGQAFGASVGGQIIVGWGLAALPLAAGLVLALAAVASQLASRRALLQRAKNLLQN